MQIDLVVAVAGVLGALAGAVTFLFRQLVVTKNRRINELLDERDYWRDTVLRSAKMPDGSAIPDYETWYSEQHRMPRPGRETYVRNRPEE